jgi:hypothetical protein
MRQTFPQELLCRLLQMIRDTYPKQQRKNYPYPDLQAFDQNLLQHFLLRLDQSIPFVLNLEEADPTHQSSKN